MDTTINQLNELRRQGIITEQAYADALDVINSRERAPIPAPRAPIPAPRRRAPAPIPAPRRGLFFRRTRWAIGNFLRSWQMDVPRGYQDPLAFLNGVRPQIRQKLTEEILDLKGVKFQLALNIHLRKIRPDGGEEYTNSTFRYKQQALLREVEIIKALDEAFPHILEILEKWTQNGSGWTVDYISTLWLDIAKYQPLRGGSYIPLPAAVNNKKAVVNVKNNDDHCLTIAYFSLGQLQFRQLFFGGYMAAQVRYSNVYRSILFGLATPNNPFWVHSQRKRGTRLSIGVYFLATPASTTFSASRPQPFLGR